MRFVSVLVLVLAVFVGFAGKVEAADYSDAQIEAAINTGWEGDIGRIMHRCTAAVGGGWNAFANSVLGNTGRTARSWIVEGFSPLARIAQEADAAKRRYAERPSVGDARELLGDDVFVVYATPQTGDDMRTAAALRDTRVETVVVRPRGDRHGRQTVQPLSVDYYDSETVQNIFGSSVDLYGIVATFSSDAVREIIAENDLEVLIIAARDPRAGPEIRGDEFKCNLDDTRLERGYGVR